MMTGLSRNKIPLYLLLANNIYRKLNKERNDCNFLPDDYEFSTVNHLGNVFVFHREIYYSFLKV
jgi:hypothetical protein